MTGQDKTKQETAGLTSTQSFFDLDGETYLGRDPARGPWSPDHCHAGPVAGAIARSIEQSFGPDKALTRLTIDLIRPVPVAGFSVAVQIMRNGRRLATANAVLTGLDGKIAAMATAMLIAPAPQTDIPSGPILRLSRDTTRAAAFPIVTALHDRPFISNFMDILYPEDEDGQPGPTKLWMRTPALVAGETPSSFQRICPLADCGNALSRNGEIAQYNFLNTDLTIVAHRQTDAQWLMSDAVSHWHRNGIGLAEAHISDETGVLATALQSLIIAPQ